MPTTPLTSKPLGSKLGDPNKKVRRGSRLDIHAQTIVGRGQGAWKDGALLPPLEELT